MSERSQGSRRVTIVDVARAAKVSRATASRALGGYGRIDPSTRDRVRAIADEIGYRPDELARAVRTGSSSTIGLVLTDIANPFFAQAAKAVMSTAAALGYDVLVANTDESAEAERRAVRVFASKRVSGLIVVPAADSLVDHLVGSGESHLPVVLLDRRLDGTGLAAVTSDDADAAGAAVELLVRRGHRRIGMIDGNSTVPGFSAERPGGLVSAAADRIDGFVAGMRDAGLEVQSGWMCYARFGDAEAATAAAVTMLSRTVRPTAVVANNSDVALSVMAACTHLGLAVGQDVSLIAFDDADWTRVSSPPVSVIARPVRQIGEAAVHELLAQIGGAEPSARPVVLPNRLVDRGSVALWAEQSGG